MSMRREWCDFRAHLTHFRSCDVKNVIFLKTAVTPLFLTFKTSSKNKNDRISFSGQLRTKINILLCRNWQKTSVNNVTMLTKILTCYISVTVPEVITRDISGSLGCPKAPIPIYQWVSSLLIGSCI